MDSSIQGYPTTRRASLFLAILLGIVATSSWAQVTNLSAGGTINYSSLVGPSGLSVQIGDKLFSDFGFSFVDTDGIPGDDISASAVVLASLSNQVGFGVSIQLPLNATGINIADITLQFTTTVLDPNKKISDVHLDFQGTATGNGIAQVSETISTNGFGIGSIANLDLTKNASGFIPTNGEASVILSTPQTKIWVQKDIFVSGNPNAVPGIPETDFASISAVDQMFSQIPEPSTVALFLVGMVPLLFVRRRR